MLLAGWGLGGVRRAAVFSVAPATLKLSKLGEDVALARTEQRRHMFFPLRPLPPPRSPLFFFVFSQRLCVSAVNPSVRPLSQTAPGAAVGARNREPRIGRRRISGSYNPFKGNTVKH